MAREAGFSKIASMVSPNSWDKHERPYLDTLTHWVTEQIIITESMAFSFGQSW